MIAGWMVYALVLGALCGLLGLAAEHVLRALRLPLRWAWVGAITLSLSLPPTLASGGRASGPALEPGASGAELSVELVRSVSALQGLSPAVALALDRSLLLLWAAASILLLVLLGRSALTLRRERRSWRDRHMAGSQVLLSPDRGPAVVGFVRPSIVVPHRVIEWDPPLQRLVVAHEREHVEAGDPLLGLGAVLALVLAPWNLPLWWHASRLRTAIELDCDARVLGSSSQRRQYAELLLRMGAAEPAWGVAAMPFTEGRISLERRIRAIAEPRPRPGPVTAALIGVALLVPPVMQAIPAPQLPVGADLARIGSGAVEVESERIGPLESPPSPPDRPPDLTLPGAPSPPEVADALRRHHPRVVDGGLSSGRAVWFVVDEDGNPLRTGVERGTDQQIVDRVRAAHPALVSDYMLVFVHQTSEGATVRVLWLIPEPTEPVPHR